MCLTEWLNRSTPVNHLTGVSMTRPNVTYNSNNVCKRAGRFDSADSDVCHNRHTRITTPYLDFAEIT
jgi:hypothetical protein